MESYPEEGVGPGTAQPREDFRDDAAERLDSLAAASDRVDRKDMADRSLEERPCLV